MQKCSSKEHKDNEAILFCCDCKIYICNKCEIYHSKLFENHHQYKLEGNKDINEIFTGYCKESNHFLELKYFCKTHNILCCSECITKFKGKEHGQHTDCDVCSINDIENEKKNKLDQNIKCLEKLSLNLKESIKELQTIFKNIEENKEEIKLNIQKVFTKLRNCINDREDELLIYLNNKFDELYYKGNIIEESEKFPKKIEISLEKGKLINNNWKNNNLKSLINDCLNIENNINEINKINQNIEKTKRNNRKMNFIYIANEIKTISDKIKNFGTIGDLTSYIIDKEGLKKLNEWIGGDNNFILKYSTINDGCDTNIFHEKCDGISGCIFICKVLESDIIGGYLTAKIQKKDEYSNDSKAFIFNLSKNILKKNKRSYSNAIKNYKDSSYFIKFGGCDCLLLSGNCLNDSQSKVGACDCKNNFDTSPYNLFNRNSCDEIKIENFEVFQVIGK